MVWRRYILLFVIVLAIVQYRLWFGETGIIASKLLEGEIKQTFHIIKTLQQENQKLREKALFYENNPTALEGMARKYLGLTRKGETLVKIRVLASTRHK